jgi:hypothetical protein
MAEIGGNTGGSPIVVKTRDSSTTRIIIYGLVTAGVIAIGYWGILKPILNSLGITRSKEDKEGDKAEDKLSRKQVFSPNLYNENKSKVTISSGTASSNALNIYDAKWGGSFGLYDNEALAVGSITSAGSLVNISYIAYTFQRIYGRDMYSYLDSFLEPSDYTTIDNYIEKTKKF